MILVPIVLGFVACHASSAAEADYLAEQAACIDKAATRADADQCRNAVKARWAVKDAGAE